MSSDNRTLLWDYVPWEQMSKQRRGVMWSLQLARNLNRQLVLPSFRFLTTSDPRKPFDDPDNAYEYRPYSHIFDVEPLRQLHPVLELHEFAERTGGGRGKPRVDLLFSILRGVSPELRGITSGLPLWKESECNPSLTMANPGRAECAIDEDGSERCVTPVAFAGTDIGVHNHTCGWAPEMRWDHLLQTRAVRELPSVGMQGIIYQLPPPTSMAELISLSADRATGTAECGWRCPYSTIRLAMVYQPRLIKAARRFLAAARSHHSGETARHAAIAAARLPAPAASSTTLTTTLNTTLTTTQVPPPVARVLAVHWRRGDFALSRGGSHETECADVATGSAIKPCALRKIVLTPGELAAAITKQMAMQHAAVVFLATDAKPGEINELRAALGTTPLLRYEPPAESVAIGVGNDLSTDRLGLDGKPLRAVMDTLICALSDAFLGTRRSMCAPGSGRRVESAGPSPAYRRPVHPLRP